MAGDPTPADSPPGEPMPGDSMLGDSLPGAGPRPGAIAVLAPAKINLWLHLVGRRADGYHLLDSLVAFAELGDTLEARPATALTLAVEGPFAAALPPGDDNLVLRAARRLAAVAGVAAGARLTLNKRLPAAAGIGGGSADAAATLAALCRLWRIDPGARQLAALALELGADVPVCLAGRAAFVTGIGEAIVPAPPLPPAPLLLVNPGVALATAAVFRARAAAGAPFGQGGPRWSDAPADAAALAARLADSRNDLEPAARALAPVVGEALAAIAAQPGCLVARMSGSGATCFGIFAAADQAACAAAVLAARRLGWWVAPTRLRAAPPGS